MSKSPQKAIDASKAASRVAMESAQAIASINQKTAQEFAELIQQRVSDLMKAHDPKTAFDYVHAEVLQDAAKEVSQYHQKLLKERALGITFTIGVTHQVTGILGVVHVRDKRHGNQTCEEGNGDSSHNDQSGLSILDLGCAECGDTVGDCFHPGKGGRTRSECAKKQQNESRHRSLGNSIVNFNCVLR